MSAREITVRIARVPGKRGRYVARYHAELLGATYSVEFPDSVTGGMALHGFAEMLRLKYELRPVELELEDHAVRSRPIVVVDGLRAGSAWRACGRYRARQGEGEARPLLGGPLASGSR